MLRDFCDTFHGDEALGISCPISPAMYKGSTVHPKCSEEDTDTPRQTSQDDGPTHFNQGESHRNGSLENRRGHRMTNNVSKLGYP